MRRSVQAVLDNYARYWVESFRLPGTSSEELDAGMSFDGFHRIENAVDSGIGPILALPHLGGLGVGRLLAGLDLEARGDRRGRGPSSPRSSSSGSRPSAVRSA